ncbi:MAG TPA: NAD-dependent epimerase/dehydratase family protein, partial [Solirubrobacteraceae bacterium]
MSPLRVTLTGATGLIGSAVVASLTDRGAEVTVLSRDPERARAQLGDAVRAVRWDPQAEAAP